jgi:hypothetical protein
VGNCLSLPSENSSHYSTIMQRLLIENHFQSPQAPHRGAEGRVSSALCFFLSMQKRLAIPNFCILVRTLCTTVPTLRTLVPALCTLVRSLRTRVPTLRTLVQILRTRVRMVRTLVQTLRTRVRMIRTLVQTPRTLVRSEMTRLSEGVTARRMEPERTRILCTNLLNINH